MESLKIATVQFETQDNDRAYGLSIIQEVYRKVPAEGADVVTFYECSVCGYAFAKDLSRKELLAIAELIPMGENTQALITTARGFGATLLAGFLERDGDRVYETQVCVDSNGLEAKYRKLHPPTDPNILPDDQYVVFEVKGWKCGILICYDNNIIESACTMALLGVDIIFMSHTTMCIPSPHPGVGLINPILWKNRANDPTSLRQEFDGLKGRAWLMRWLPIRACDNAVYVVFSSPIGHDYNEIRSDCSTILDPLGSIVTEHRRLDDDFVTATAILKRLRQTEEYHYRDARRPEFYTDIIDQPHESNQKVAWLTETTSK